MRTTLSATAVSALLLLSACGGSSGDSAADTSAPSDTSAASGTGAATDTTIDYGFTGEDSTAFCNVAGKLNQNDPLDNLSSDADPAVIDPQWAAYRAVIDEVASKAPAEIADDFTKIAGAVKAFGDAYSDAGWDEAKFTEVMTSNTELQQLLTSEEFDDAGNRVDAYVEHVCGISPG